MILRKNEESELMSWKDNKGIYKLGGMLMICI